MVRTKRPLNLAVLALTLAASAAQAKPPAPTVLCEVFPDAAGCQAGVPDCTTCHTAPPARNAFGQALEALLLPGAPRPLTDEVFRDALPAALAMLGDADTDEDGFDTETELTAGTGPGDKLSFPRAFEACNGNSQNPGWNVCGRDRAHVFKKLKLDVCGRAPGYAELMRFRGLEPEAQDAQLDTLLDECLRSAFWLGTDGVLWRMANAKIRPIWAVKSGKGGGPVPLADYDDDYSLFTWTQSGDRDAREVLTAQYYVRQVGPTRYERVEGVEPEGVTEYTQPERRAGMLTTGWFFVVNTMFTPVPRTTAAQAYRSYLGLDIAKSEGLIEPEGELVDYDDKGVTAPGCAACHRTLDPLSYPFSRYWGIASDSTGVYDERRLRRFDANEGRRLNELPEAGALFGEPVADLLEWAERAANSEAFARATVADYWRHFIGRDPTPAEKPEFDALVSDFRDQHGYRVESMLHALIRTEAYGVP